MIALLRGRVASVESDWAVIDVGGVGYRVFASAATLGRLAGATGEVTVHTITNVREDAIHLFGFLEVLERELFLLLVGITGIGPKVAVGILGGMGAGELVDCIATEDVRRLTKLPGVGKKLAERMILELRGKMPDAPRTAAPRPSAVGRVWDDLRSALLNLGYKGAAVEKALDGLQAEGEAGTIEELLRRALRLMG